MNTAHQTRDWIIQREEVVLSKSVLGKGAWGEVRKGTFRSSKQNGRTICFKCFEEDGVVNFFLEGAGLSQYFRTMHRINAVLDSAKCKAVFELFFCKKNTS